MSEGWTFRLLGPLEVRHDGVPVPVVAAKQRVLIAALALAAGAPVTAERLITYLWDERPPASARNTVQNYVLRLRRTLRTATAAPGTLVTTSTSAYHLDVDADAIDVHRFRTLLRSARSEATAGERAAASALLAEALGLWRGDPLVDVPSDLLHREVVPALVEQRLAAQEQRIVLDLQLGRHQDLVTELVALTAAYPVRERMWAQLMLALYRCGRTSEALEAYQRAASVLAEELGVDPGPELQRMHQAVLTNDPNLTITGPPQETVARPATPVVPRQLPAAAGHFVGRGRELRHLSAQLAAGAGSTPMVITAIGGSAGIGKTALAVYWGHQHADRFPDGQLYVNLRGFDPSATPTPPETVIRGFLTALGVPTQHIPADPDEQSALYRSHLAGKRMLVVLDNARDTAQVRPLLPGAPGCLVLITSRDQLTGLIALDGALPLTLDLLTHDEARDLLIRRLGRDRVAQDETVVDELIEACARLPLALNIAAAHAALHPTRPLAALAGELRDAHRRLDILTTGDAAADVRAMFSWSYRTLTPAAARTFRLLGLHPGADISLSAAANLTDLDLTRTRRAMDELVRAHLITEHTPGRYTLHDLLRAYAADQARSHDSEPERRDALRRVVDFYLHTAHNADRILDPHRTLVPLDPPAPGTQPLPLPDVPAALGWLDTEHPALLAAQHAAAGHAWHPVVWQLAWTLITFHDRRGHRHDRLTVWRAAVAAAEHLPDPTKRTIAHRFLGYAHASLDRHEEAIGHLHLALALAEQHHTPDQRGHTHRALAVAWTLHGDGRQALEHATHARDLYRTLDQPVWEANALGEMGWYAAQLGEHDTARIHCHDALTLHRQHHNPTGEAATLDSLGYIVHLSGHHEQAVDYYQQALVLRRALGNTAEAANTLDALARPYVALGNHEQARTAWQEALHLYQQQRRDHDADRVQRQLDTLDHVPAR